MVQHDFVYDQRAQFSRLKWLWDDLLTSSFFIRGAARPAQLRDQVSDQKWRLISSVIWQWNRWEWKENGSVPGSVKSMMAASWPLLLPFSVTFKGRVSLCYRHPSPWQLSQTPLPLPSGARRTERPEWENSYIYNFFSSRSID